MAYIRVEMLGEEFPRAEARHGLPMYRTIMYNVAIFP